MKRKGPRAGFNPRTGAQPQMKPRGTPSSQNYTSQGEAMVKASPEPFRNPMAAPKVGMGTEAASMPMAGVSGNKPSLNAGAVGGMNGSNNGKVASPQTPRKAGPAEFPPVKSNPAPSFYGGSSTGTPKGTVRDNSDQKPKAGLAKSAQPHLPQTNAVATPLNAPGAGRHAGKVVGARFYGR